MGIGTGIEKRTYLDFKKGDLVKIRTWEDMEEQYGATHGFISLSSHISFTQGMRKLCDRKYIVQQVVSGGVRLAPKGHKITTDYWIITTEMLEIVEENYIENHRLRAKERVEKMGENEEEIIKEMISKVDKAKLKRILAGSYGIALPKLKGIDELIEQWAKSKKYIYLLFDKKLKIDEEFEFDISPQEMRTKITELELNYPRLSLCF